ncbi:MAG: FG-GAP-like repeat-containing protein [Bacteroidota bacterium]
MGRSLSVTAVVLGLSGTAALKAQNFDPSVTDPFNIASVNEVAVPDLVDIDNDGDLDLFVGELGDDFGIIQYFENIGTAQAPNYAAPMLNPFGISAVNQEAHPRFVDIDGDGDFDLFAGEFGGDMMYMENTGTATSPAFAAPLRNPFNLTSCNDQAYLSFPDLDGDGDFDLMAGEVGGTLQFFDNIGTATAPAFGPSFPNPFGLQDVSVLSSPAAADLDGDGDFDLIVGETEGNVRYFENTGSSSAPAFASPVLNPFGIEQGDEAAAPTLKDIDNDGDLDLLMGEAFGTVHFQENQAIVSADAAQAAFASVQTFPNPTQGRVTVAVRADRPIQNLEAVVYDLTGRRLFSQAIAVQGGEVNFSLELGELARGVYQLQLNSDRGVAVEQIVVE